MKIKTKYILLGLLIGILISFILYFFISDRVSYDSKENKKQSTQMNLVVEEGFENDSVCIWINSKNIFKQKVTSDPSNSMASDFITIELNTKTKNKIKIQNGICSFNGTINPLYKTVIIRKDILGLKVIYTNNNLSYD